jgi:hypothetical protein
MWINKSYIMNRRYGTNDEECVLSSVDREGEDASRLRAYPLRGPRMVREGETGETEHLEQVIAARDPCGEGNIGISEETYSV